LKLRFEGEDRGWGSRVRIEVRIEDGVRGEYVFAAVGLRKVVLSKTAVL